jgi:hypothetical protein
MLEERRGEPGELVAGRLVVEFVERALDVIVFQ